MPSLDRIGLEAAIYVFPNSSTLLATSTSSTSGMTLQLGNVGDINMDLPRDILATNKRSTGFQTGVPGQIDGTLTFDMFDDYADSDFYAIMSAYVDNVPISLKILETTDVDAKYPRAVVGNFTILECPLNGALEEAQKVTIKAEPHSCMKYGTSATV
jgi:hypothetical protein